MSKVQRPEPEMIGLREYARRVGISFTKAYEAARRDELLVPAYKHGCRWVVSRVALDHLIHRQHGEPIQAEAA